MPPKFPIAKKDKREIIEDFIQHLDNAGIVFAEESETEDGKIVLDKFTGIADQINRFLAYKKSEEEE